MERLLIAGFGDIARRALPLLATRFEIRLLGRSSGLDLDRPGTLSALEGAHAVLHCVPPPLQGETDPRTTNLLAALEATRILPTRLVYISTSGVYGDCGGALVDESRPVNPRSARARRRVHAEEQLALWCRRHRVACVVLRAPGIYAVERLPLGHLRAGVPALRQEEDVYTSHVHAEDLAAACARALQPDAAPGIYNACDDTRMKMGDWLDLVADHARLPRPPRIARAQAAERVPAAMLDFMSESRRLDNTRLKRVLGVRLRFATVREGLEHEHAVGAD
jgi:nucleoside-diphosphate-sugar epimerase